MKNPNYKGKNQQKITNQKKTNHREKINSVNYKTGTKIVNNI